MTPITTKELGKIYQTKDWTSKEIQKMHGVDVTFKTNDYPYGSPDVICTGKISTSNDLHIVHNNKKAKGGEPYDKLGFKYGWSISSVGIIGGAVKWIKLLDTPNNRNLLGMEAKEHTPKEGELVYVSDKSVEDAIEYKCAGFFIKKEKGLFTCAPVGIGTEYDKHKTYFSFGYKYIAQIPQEDKEPVQEHENTKLSTPIDGITIDEKTADRYLNIKQTTETGEETIRDNRVIITPDTKVSWDIDGVIFEQGEKVEMRDNDSEEWIVSWLSFVSYNMRYPYLDEIYNSWKQIRKLPKTHSITIEVTVE